MKQCVKIKLTESGGASDVRIRSISQIDNQLIVISEIFPVGNGWCNDAIGSIEDHVVVNIPLEQPLPVIHYLMSTTEKGKTTAEYYCSAQKHLGGLGEPDSLCTPIANIDELPKAHQGGVKRFELSANNRRTFRQDRAFARAHDARGNDEGHAALEFSPEKVQAILNIYPIIADDYIQFMLEQISNEHDNYFHASLAYRLETCTWRANLSKDFLNNTAMMRCDDPLYLDATFSKKETNYKTEGVEFTLPETVADFTTFVRFMDKFLERFRKEEGIVILSLDSILVHFDDVFISELGGKYIIENDLPISLETFLNLPGTHAQPESLTPYFTKLVGENESLTRYAKLRAELANKSAFLPSVTDSGLNLFSAKPQAEPAGAIACTIQSWPRPTA